MLFNLKLVIALCIVSRAFSFVINSTIHLQTFTTSATPLPDVDAPTVLTALNVSHTPRPSAASSSPIQPLLNTDVKQQQQQQHVPEGVNSFSQVHKFLVNSSQEVPIKTRKYTAITSLNVIILLVCMVIVALIIAVVLTALFVMKRRFNILRISGNSKDCGANSNDGAASGMLAAGSDNSSRTSDTTEAANQSASSAPHQDKCSEVNETNNVTEALKEAAIDNNTDDVVECHAELMSVENKQAVLLLPVSTVEEEVAKQEEVAPAQEAETVSVPEVVQAVVMATTTSSTSLIANVLNELSESVVSKLQSDDPEKQPLNVEKLD